MAFMSSKKGTQAAVKRGKQIRNRTEDRFGASEVRTSLFKGRIRKEQSG